MKTHATRLLVIACVLTAMAAVVIARPKKGYSVEQARERYEELVRQRDLNMSAEKQLEFAREFYGLKIWKSMWYLGIKILKNPNDLWMMQQIIFEVKPDYIIETGTAGGGSALYWAHILDGLDLTGSKVITLDIDDSRIQDAAQRSLWKEYVTFFHSSSTDEKTVKKIARMVKGKKVLVTLDSLHTMEHVLKELRMYGPLVSPGSYLVVEDTFLDGAAGVAEPGPMAAVNTYLEGGGSKMFERDLTREALVLTYNPGGWLRRKAD